jgi:hypothetical protein
MITSQQGGGKMGGKQEASSKYGMGFFYFLGNY